MPGREFLFGRLDHVAGQPDGTEVGVRLREPAEQVERAVHDVVGVVAAVEQEPPGRLVQRGQARLPAGCCRPGQEAFRVQLRVEPAAGKQQPEVVAQAVGGYAGVHQDRLGGGRDSPGNIAIPRRPIAVLNARPQIPWSCGVPWKPAACPQRGPVGSALVVGRRDSGHRGRQAGWPARQQRVSLGPGILQVGVEPAEDGGDLAGAAGRRSASATSDALLSRGRHESSRSQSSSRMLTCRGEARDRARRLSGAGRRRRCRRADGGSGSAAAGTCSARRCRTRRDGPGPECRPRTGRSVPAAGPGRARRGPRSPG